MLVTYPEEQQWEEGRGMRARGEASRKVLVATVEGGGGDVGQCGMGVGGGGIRVVRATRKVSMAGGCMVGRG